MWLRVAPGPGDPNDPDDPDGEDSDDQNRKISDKEDRLLSKREVTSKDHPVKRHARAALHPGSQGSRCGAYRVGDLSSRLF